ncbi:hypothetical protein EIP91_004572 [Steccherinum ochraceum]|uniref:BTB domain-containing protein n=1 Tax=Steccherinum ochraceum TaxID=92696 RepID=A0A4R0RNX9_9APHY|nr:hypothetical protein EIP91_004572 [Steccherinum ochraceum]
MLSGSDHLLPGVHHRRLYFADGDIVLSSVSAKMKTTMYKVDKIYLSRQSEVFQGMFTMPASSTDLYDGVPWVRMPDPTEELSPLLEALYDVSTLKMVRHSPNTAIRLSGAMKLAKKYEIHSLRRAILRHMENDWPQTVDEWIEYHRSISRAQTQHLNTSPSYLHAGRYIDERFPEPGSTLRFALDYHCPTLLRAATMVMVTASEQSNYEEIVLSKFDMQYEAAAAKRTLLFPLVRWSLLTRRELDCLEYGKKVFREELRKLGNGETQLIDPPTCGGCTDKLVAWRNHVFTMGGKVCLEERELTEPISECTKLLEEGKPAGVCVPCWSRTVKAIMNKRQELWDQIPKIFQWQSLMSD